MSREHCQDCGAVVGAGCACAPDAGFHPLRVRPYVTLPDPGEPDEVPPAPRPAEPAHETPAYGIPAAPANEAWPGAGTGAGPGAGPAETVQLAEVPAGPEFAAGPGGPPDWSDPGSGSGPDSGSGRRGPRRLLPILLGAAAALALGGTALAVWVMPDPAGSDTALLDAKASTPAAIAPPPPSESAATTTAPASPSASPSPSPSPSAPKSPTPSPSRSSASASPSPTPSATRSPSPSPPPPTTAPTLRYGDTGAEVEKLQRLLAAKGLFPYRANGKFDWRVENAVSTFQYNNDIDEEWGVYGPVTRRALEG